MEHGGFPGGTAVKDPPANASDVGSIPGSGRSPRVGNGNLLQYSYWENLHGQRSLAGYSPWGHRESEMTELLTLSLFTYICIYVCTHTHNTQ